MKTYAYRRYVFPWLKLIRALVHAIACLSTTRAAGLLPVLMWDCQPFSHVPVTRFRHRLSWPDLAGVG